MQKMFKYMLTAVSASFLMLLAGCSSSNDNGNDSALGIYNVRQIVAENNKTERAIMWNSKDTMPIFEKFKVDAVLTAHLHTYRRRVPLWNFEPNPKGITYILTGIAGNVQYAKLWDNWENDAARAPYPETMNYLTMEADGEKLRFECFLPDGKKIDEVEIRK